MQNLHFEDLGVHRRAALQLIPYVSDPELNHQMKFSKLKSSRSFHFISKDKITLSGGYRICRTTRFIPFDGNNYYFELTFERTNDNSHVRFGISTLSAEIESSVGYDEYGYCVRDKGGAFHCGKEYPSPPFSPGDVIGIGLFPDNDSFAFKLFINGEDKGVIFDSINPTEFWFPTVSIYEEAVVTADFVRPFQYDPGDSWKSANDLPRYQTSDLFTSRYLVNVMKGEIPVPKEHEKEIMDAMDVALIPSHIMPI
ncbi:SPRY domain containing protein [Histomonas meleagridis]|uniref:SPRY domain containing protein n=1 Tax=Histomonas meleagridis TaxID=135588 RepID=UPI0035598EBC|nr:SPRY domain containing protein [Histomonas meleagridis]KAH0798415.1 SPRY domain containing protein [Histomonas meleagridis]